MIKPKKIVLAYSGGLDTSVILKWLQEQYNCEIVTFTANLGQEEDWDFVKQKAQKLGVKEIFIEDLREEFIKDYVFPMFRSNAIYEGEYLLGTSIARPLIAKRQIEIAKMVGADAVAHGATGKGNDQIRFEMGYYANNPKIKVIAPWRIWDLDSREKLITYAKKNGVEVPSHKNGEAPYSIDANLLHTSIEGKVLEDAWNVPTKDIWQISKDISETPNEPEEVELEFAKGDLIAINGTKLSPAKLLEKLNELGTKHGVGRVDIVENRTIGIKSRGLYETPGGTILLKAHRAIESITLEKEACHLKDELMPKYAKMIYEGMWFTMEREMLQSAIDLSQKNVNGFVRLQLYKGNVIVNGRKSPNSIYNVNFASFDVGNDPNGYDHKDAEAFIKLKSLRFKV